MAKKQKPAYYHIHTIDIINSVVDASLACYGVVGIADKKEIRDEVDPLNKEKGKIEEGVIVTRFADHSFAVTVYLILAENLKVTETLRECQKRIHYVLEKKYPTRCRYVSALGAGLGSIQNI